MSKKPNKSFSSVVNFIVHNMCVNKITPEDILDAAEYAVWRYEEYHLNLAKNHKAFGCKMCNIYKGRHK